MIGKEFKGRGESCARTRFQPVRTENGFPSERYYGYLRKVNGHAHPWMCYCVFRRDWLIRSLVAMGVNVEHFMPPSRKIPKGKCREVARALIRLEKEKPHLVEDYDLLETDIAFWSHCGGVRIHNCEAAY